MDAYKPENTSTDLENVSQELLDIESTTPPEEGAPSLEMLLEQEELKQSQTLEAEFADFTQHFTGSDLENFGELDSPFNLETDSDIDLDLELATFQMEQPLETAESDKSSSDFDLGENATESNDLQTEGELDIEFPEILEEMVEPATLSGMDVTPELAMISDLEVTPDQDVFAELDMSETELASELTMPLVDDIELDAPEPDDLEMDGGLDVELPDIQEEPTPDSAVAFELASVSADDLGLESEASLEPEGVLEEPMSSELGLATGAAEFESPYLPQEADEPPQNVSDQIDPAEFDALQVQSKNQSVLIAKLEAEIETLKVNYEQSQLASEQMIAPEVYQSIQAEVQQLTAQVQDWEQRYESLSQRLDQQTQLANDRIDPEVHASLNQKVQQYSEQVQTLQSEKEALEETMQHWQSQAESKIDRMEYEAVFEQLQRLKERNARSLWTKIMDWVKGN